MSGAPEGHHHIRADGKGRVRVDEVGVRERALVDGTAQGRRSPCHPVVHVAHVRHVPPRETPLVVADSDAEEAELVLAVDEVGVLVHDVAPPVLEGGLLHLEDNAIERAHLKRTHAEGRWCECNHTWQQGCAQ